MSTSNPKQSMGPDKPVEIQVAGSEHLKFAESICAQMLESAKARGTGIAKRSPEYIREKIAQHKAIIALDVNTGEWAGFCYIESWSHGKYVANSGLIVLPKFRGLGLATSIKERAFYLSREKYPDAKLFGLTTSQIVMNINSDLGYRPTTFEKLTDDKQFWDGCKTCINHPILVEKQYRNCLCTGMLFEPNRKKKQLELKQLEKEKTPNR